MGFGLSNTMSIGMKNSILKATHLQSSNGTRYCRRDLIHGTINHVIVSQGVVTLVKFCRQKSILSMHKAQHTQKSLTNQAAFCQLSFPQCAEFTGSTCIVAKSELGNLPSQEIPDHWISSAKTLRKKCHLQANICKRTFALLLHDKAHVSTLQTEINLLSDKEHNY